MTTAAIILALVTVQRIGELVLSRRNTQRLLARGGYEVGRQHYPFIVLIHAAWLGALWWLGPGRAVEGVLIALFLLLQLGRGWVLLTMGARWTTRVIVVPGERLVRSGPFRFVRHPNYIVVIGEIAVLPLAFGLCQIAVLFSALNAVALAIRIRAEDAALRGAQA